MGSRITVVRAGERSATELAALSRGSLDRPLRDDAELWIALARDGALAVGAFQRARDLPDRWPLVRRGSGGPEVLVGPETIHLALSLANPAALVRADARRIVNRAVRPLLRALTRVGYPAHFFGRDWVSVAHRPAAWVGFAHDAHTGRTFFEAFVATSTPFAWAPRSSFRGKSHGTLAEIGGRAVDPLRVVTAVAEAYSEGHEACEADPPPRSLAAPPDSEDLRADPPWEATCDEAIGTIGAGRDARGVFRIGGDLLVSRDALAELEAAASLLGAAASDVDVGGEVDQVLSRPAVALDGVRSLSSVRDVIVRALRAGVPAPRLGLP